MDSLNPNRTRIIGLRLTASEYTHLEREAGATTYRSVSEYVRRLLFHKPVTVLQRNASIDDLMAELIYLRAELTTVLSHCQGMASELQVQSTLLGFLTVWYRYEKGQQGLVETVEKVHHQLDKIADQWLQ